MAERELSGPLKSKVDSTDVAQDALLLAHEHFDQFQGHSGSELLAWLRRILLNCIIGVHRHYASTQKRDLNLEVRLDQNDSQFGGAMDVEDSELTPSSQAVAAEEARAIDSALAKLPPNYQLVIRMRYWERRSLEEIGQQLGKSADAARKIYVRAIRKFVRHWEDLPR